MEQHPAFLALFKRISQIVPKKSAEEKWALLDKDIEMEDSETENENRNGRTSLHHTISLHYNVM